MILSIFVEIFNEKIISGELSYDFRNKVKTELDKQVAKDPWKENFFEDVWGFRYVIGQMNINKFYRL